MNAAPHFVPGRRDRSGSEYEGPGGIAMMRHALAVRPLRRLPITFGAMCKRGVPDDLMERWLAPRVRREIRP